MISNSITHIEGDLFQGCSHLKEIFVEIDRTAVKTSGKIATVTARIDGGLFDTPASVKLEVGTAVIDEALSNKKADEVVLKVLVTANDSCPKEDVTPESIVLQKEAVKALADSKKSFKLQVRDAGGSSYYVRVKAADLKKVTGNLPLAVCRKEVADTSGNLNADLKKVFKKNSTKAENAEIFSYNFEKGSKTTVSLTIPAKNVGGAKPEVYVYRYDKDKRIFAATSFHPYTVTEKGNIRLTISKGGTFVVTKKAFSAMSRKPASEFITEGSATYYIDKNGEPVRGWKKLGSEYYYFDRENGKMAAGKTVDSVKLTADGTAKQTEAGVERIKTMIKARAMVEKVTKPTDSIEQKRRSVSAGYSSSISEIPAFSADL